MQAPQVWYNNIESYFAQMFERCFCERTSFTKTEQGRRFLVVSLYVNNLTFTGNDEPMFERFKDSMKQKFDV